MDSRVQVVFQPEWRPTPTDITVHQVEARSLMLEFAAEAEADGTPEQRVAYETFSTSEQYEAELRRLGKVYRNTLLNTIALRDAAREQGIDLK